MKEARIMNFPPFILTEFSSHNFDNDDIEASSTKLDVGLFIERE